MVFLVTTASVSFALVALTASTSSAAFSIRPDLVQSSSIAFARRPRPRPSTELLSFRPDTDRSTGNRPDMFDLALMKGSFASKSKGDVSRCLCEVVGLPEEIADLVAAQAQQHGVSLIEELPRKCAAAYLEELTSRGLVCDMVASEPCAKPRSFRPESLPEVCESARLPEIWMLALTKASFAKQSKEEVSRCLREVVGLSETAAESAATRAQRHGDSWIEEFPLEYAEAYFEELTTKGLVCEMVAIED